MKASTGISNLLGMTLPQLQELCVNEGFPRFTAKQISDGASLSARYCLLTQQGNYRSQVVNNFIALLAEALQLDVSGVLPAPEEKGKQ